MINISTKTISVALLDLTQLQNISSTTTTKMIDYTVKLSYNRTLHNRSFSLTEQFKFPVTVEYLYI